MERREFLKTTTLAGMAATLPASGLLAESRKPVIRRSPAGNKRNLLFLNDNPAEHQKLIDAIQSIKEYSFSVMPVKVDLQKSEEIIPLIQGKEIDAVLFRMPRMGISTGNLAAVLGDLDVPIILFPPNLDLIMLEADLAANLRRKGAHAMLANSEARLIELLKITAAPRILEGKRAVIFGRPFESSSVPARNLSEEYVYKRTGVKLSYRPIAELKTLLAGVDETRARQEMERWKKEAARVVEPTDKAILDASRLYVLLRSIADKEGLSAISIDCLSFSFDRNPMLPYPCLSFTRLRDDGIAAPCEADVCASLTSMLLQEISKKPSYFCNVSSVDTQKSTTVLRHCVAPLRLMGADKPALPYNLRDYHGFGRGVVPEVQFPVGIDVTLGGFSKDLTSFVLWPGRIDPGIHDMERPSFTNAPPEYEKVRMFCSNRAELKIKDADRFVQSIAGIHHAMVAGSYTSELQTEMLKMNVNIVGPSDLAAPRT